MAGAGTETGGVDVAVTAEGAGTAAGLMAKAEVGAEDADVVDAAVAAKGAGSVAGLTVKADVGAEDMDVDVDAKESGGAGEEAGVGAGGVVVVVVEDAAQVGSAARPIAGEGVGVGNVGVAVSVAVADDIGVAVAAEGASDEVVVAGGMGVAVSAKEDCPVSPPVSSGLNRGVTYRRKRKGESNSFKAVTKENINTHCKEDPKTFSPRLEDLLVVLLRDQCQGIPGIQIHRVQSLAQPLNHHTDNGDAIGYLNEREPISSAALVMLMKQKRRRAKCIRKDAGDGFTRRRWVDESIREGLRVGRETSLEGKNGIKQKSALLLHKWFFQVFD
ncbi:hypothetical protein F5878DRAFT_646967 [Lentinula raphanica]|uniref:Uncharacterized protein n=1 Tax=Lentinula raphanica TaxID=153919 RepID=A0AA38NX19_9AGAR|nr:hypothetical protein F5878DRAFT_646967 [Lentinula raphanica]